MYDEMLFNPEECGWWTLPRFWREIFQIVASHRLPGPPILQGINENIFTGKIHYKVNTLAGATHMSDANLLINFRSVQRGSDQAKEHITWTLCTYSYT